MKHRFLWTNLRIVFIFVEKHGSRMIEPDNFLRKNVPDDLQWHIKPE